MPHTPPYLMNPDDMGNIDHEPQGGASAYDMAMFDHKKSIKRAEKFNADRLAREAKRGGGND